MLEVAPGRRDRVRWFALIVAYAAMSAGAAAQSESAGALTHEIDQAQPVHLDVVVADATGTPISRLLPGDFTIFDDGKPRQISAFAGFDGVNAKPDIPTQMIIVIDSVNNGFVEMGYARHGLESFLRENGGRLGQPTSIAQLVSSGMRMLWEPTLDGNALADEVGALSGTVKPRGLDALHVSLNGLFTIAKKEALKPGRKLLVWLGPGWPTPVPPQSALTEVDLRNQRTYYTVAIQLARLLHDGRVTLYGGYTAGDFYMRDFLKPLRKISDVDARILRLNVLAIKSGGKGELPETNRDRALTEALDHVAAEAKSFYEISFNAPKAQLADGFHELRVTVNRPNLTARTISAYYDQPERALPETREEAPVVQREPAKEVQTAAMPVTVEQLTKLVQAARSKRDGEAANEIEPLQLTQRLSSPKLAVLSAQLPGTKSRAALIGVADLSVFLDPPKEEIPERAAPNAEELRKIASLAVEYLKNVLPRLPNFYAKRLTHSFEGVMQKHDANTSSRVAVMRPGGEFKATVLYRDGNEIAHAEGAEEQRLITRGTFGPILSTVILDAAHSSTDWARWEEGPNGLMAVLRFRVPQEKSHYQVSFPAALAGGGEISAMAPTAYHGEIAIDPNLGTILRLVLRADPELGSPLKRADIMVEYGAVNIGRKLYTCPVRGVSVSAGDSPRPARGSGVTAEVREVTQLDDVVFTDYHVFRSEMRIVPE
ncbi:MAG TPA: VWA domain-containing protein [Terracidiphilus sp.]|nr:VWA domain-containing protein [Terracidiphilus sp.]